MADLSNDMRPVHHHAPADAEEINRQRRQALNAVMLMALTDAEPDGAPAVAEVEQLVDMLGLGPEWQELIARRR